MDFFVRHWAPYPRGFASELPVLNMGDIREKDHWVRRTFSTCNFSFILRGRGEFRRKGRAWPIEAPCVLTQWPGEAPEYGPLPEGKATWDEIYLIYDARILPRLRRRGFVAEARPVWPIENLDGFQAQLAELRALTHTSDPGRAVDRVDLICERMILESLAPAPDQAAAGEREAVRQIEARLQRAPETDFDFDRLARSHGMSPSTLRRRWSSIFPTPPGQYLLDLRMQKARRLLVESEARIGEIAARVGFQDLLYFSRRFHLSTGLSPSAYRKRYRLRPPEKRGARSA
jgi:AraC-like DNA-binding protein